MIFQKMRLLGFLLLAMLIAIGNARAVDLWYDFEGDSGRTATDKLTDDGSQDGSFLGTVSIQTSPGVVPWGTQSSLFEPPDTTWLPEEVFSTIEVPYSEMLTENFTLAMHANNLEDPLDFTRLFSSYGGTGGIGADRILFDYDPSGAVLPNGIRAIVNDIVVEPTGMPAGLGDPGYHHYAVTAQSGTVIVYFDGVVVASDNVGTGYSSAGQSIHIGEDPHDLGGGANEQWIGNVDDILVIDQVLDATQIASLAGGSTVQSVVTPTGSLAVNYDFEGDSGTTITDKFTGDGANNGIVRVGTVVDTEPANAKLGSASVYFPAPDFAPYHQFSKINTGLSGTELGSAFTMSAVINVDGDGHTAGNLTRLFSSYSGESSAAGRLIMDFEPDADTYGVSVRVILPDETEVSTDQPFSYGEDHTLTAVYDGTNITIYIDGTEAKSKTANVGGVVDLGGYSLMLGEDLGGWLNEQFLGTMDDVLILGRALSAAEVATLHADGASALFVSDIPGDANRDGAVDVSDLGILATNYGTQSGAEWGDGDFTGEGRVDVSDLGVLATHYGETAPVASVPEPSTLVGLLGLYLTGLLVRARRKR